MEPVTTTAGGVAATVGGIATAVAMAYPILDAIAHEYNSKEAARKRAQLNAILAKYNVTISQLRNYMEAKNMRYTSMLDQLSTVSPAGKAFKIKSDLEAQQVRNIKATNAKINKLEQLSGAAQTTLGKQAEQLDSKGIIRTILNN